MIAFAPLRTPRLQVDMRELRGSEAIALCHLPADMPEAGTTALLNCIAPPPEKLRDGQVADARQWTVQERALAVAHYLSHILGSDFEIGEGARYSDFLLPETSWSVPAPIEVCELDGEVWSLQPLLGWHAESIERLVYAGELEVSKNGWLTGAVAAMAYRASDGPLAVSDATDAEIDKALLSRAGELVGMPEHQMMLLIANVLARLGDLDHIFKLHFLPDGPTFLSTKEVPAMQSARFPFSMAIREETQDLFGRVAGVGD